MTEKEETALPPDLPPRGWDLRPKLRWFAAEIIVVVAGILIALALNAWWQGRQDRVTEQAYLRQLAEDMHRTKRVMATAEAELRPADRAGTRLAQAYFSAQTPPQDSVFRWLKQAHGEFAAEPAVGTIRALIATGDIALIRDDTLRQVVVEYLGFAEAMNRYLASLSASWNEGAYRAGRRSTWGASYVDALDPALVDSMAMADPYSPIPRGPRRPLPPLDVEALVHDPAFYSAVYEMNLAKARMKAVRRWITGRAWEINRRIDAALE